MINRCKIFLFLTLSGFLYPHGVREGTKLDLLSDCVREGAIHMITGYDHILFLIGVVFFLRSYLDIFKFITAFTVAHCVTLIFATLFEIRANAFLIDAVIAFSVIYKGFENLDGFKKWFNSWVWFINIATRDGNSSPLYITNPIIQCRRGDGAGRGPFYSVPFNTNNT